MTVMILAFCGSISVLPESTRSPDEFLTVIDWMNVMKRATLWTVLAVLCIILLPKAAFAHAYIVKSTPAENQELKKAPAEIKIEFNEAIQPHS